MIELTLTITPLPCAAHGRQHEEGHAHGTPEVGLETRASLILGEVLDRTRQSHTRVVDQYVDAPVPREYLVHRGSRGRIISHVELEHLDLDSLRRPSPCARHRPWMCFASSRRRCRH